MHVIKGYGVWFIFAPPQKNGSNYGLAMHFVIKLGRGFPANGLAAFSSSPILLFMTEMWKSRPLKLLYLLVEWRCSMSVSSQHIPPENKPSESRHSRGRDAVLSVCLGKKGTQKVCMFAGASAKSSPWICGSEKWEGDIEKKKKAQRDTVTERCKKQLIACTVPVRKHLRSIEGELTDKSLPPTHCHDCAETVFGGHRAEQPIPVERFITGPGLPTETNTIQFAWTWPFSTRFNGGPPYSAC